jgi:hypothetical protein
VHSEAKATVYVTPEQFENPERGASAVGSRYPRTSEGQQTKKIQCLCSELQADCV